MFKLKFGKPSGAKESILALLGDTLHLKDALYTLGFQYNNVKGYWTNPIFSPHVVDYLEEVCPDIEISPIVREQYKKYLTRPTPIFENTLKSEMLLNYQIEGLDFLQKAGSSILGFDIGLGKTPTAIGYAEYLGTNTLVVCPAKLRKQWEEEIKKFTDGSKGIKVVGTPSERTKIWNSIGKYHYAIISYESFLNNHDIKFIENYVNNGLIIFDEITKLKNPKSKTFKAAFGVRQRAKFAIGLTGTPCENHLGDLYALMRIITPYYIPSYEVFAKNFLKQSSHEFFNPHTGRKIRYNRIDGEKNVDLFRDILKPIMIRKTREEVLHLPPASTIKYDIELTREQKEIEDILKSLARSYPEYILKWFIFAMENLIHPCLINVGAVAETNPFEAFEIESRIGQGLTPRMETISEILEEIGNQKIIIFSKCLN